MNIVAVIFLLIALLMVIAALFPNGNFTSPTVTVNRVIGLIIGLVLLFIVYLIVEALFGSVVVHPAAAAPLGLLALGVVNPDPGNVPAPATPPVSAPPPVPAEPTVDWHMIGYIIAAILFLVNVAIAAIQAAYAAGHGADLGISPQFQAWLAVVSTVIAAALGLLPQLTRTPSARLTSYLKAYAGELPADIAAKYRSGLPPH